MIHQPGLPEPAQGQPTDLEIQARELVRMRAQLEELLARHTGQSRERIAADIERDTILRAQDAVEYGLVDRVIDNRKTSGSASGAR